MDRIFLIYGLGTCKLNKDLKYECKEIKDGDSVDLEHLWFVTEDEYKAKEMIKFNLTDLNDGGIYPYLGFQKIRMNDTVPKYDPLIVYKYNKDKNEYHRVGHVNNLIKDESDLGFVPESTEMRYASKEELDIFKELRRKKYISITKGDD